MNPKNQSPKGDDNLAIHGAGHFFELAGNFFGALPLGKVEFDLFFKQPVNIGRLIAASTNLALSIELYLKGIALKTKDVALKSHNLIDLFDDLPADIRDSIQQRYSRRLARAPQAKVRVINFFIFTHNQPPADVGPILCQADMQHVRKVLAAEKDAFQTWRYVYEQAPAAGWSRVTVHYAHLCIVVNSIQDQFKPSDQRP